MPTDNNMIRERELHIKPNVPPEYPGTQNLGETAEGSGVGKSLLVPDTTTPDYSPSAYVKLAENPAHHGFTEKGREMANENWQYVLANAGADTNLEGIKERVTQTLDTLRSNESTQQEYVDVLEKSFRARVEYMEKTAFWSEMQATNSPWTEVVETISERVYSNVPTAFVKNFSTHAVRNLRTEISDHVDSQVQDGKISEDDKSMAIGLYESDIADEIKSYLDEADDTELAELRESGIGKLATTILERKTGHSPNSEESSVQAYIDQHAEKISGQLDSIDDIEAEDIQALESFREKVGSRFTQFKQKFDQVFPPGSKQKRILLTGAFTFGGGLSTFFGLRQLPSAQEVHKASLDKEGAVTEESALEASPAYQMAVALTTQETPRPAELEVETESQEHNEEPDTTSKPVQSIESTSTETPKPTATKTPELTPTGTPEPDFVHAGIDFSSGKSISMSGVTSNNQEIKISFDPIVYRDDFTSEELDKFFNDFAVGKGSAAVDIDKYGNTIVYIHSGYNIGSPVEAESLRLYLEGGNLSGTTPFLSETEKQERMDNFVGQKFTFTQNGVEEEFVIKAVGYIPHDRKPDFDRNTKDVLDVVIDTNGGDESDFRAFAEGEKVALYTLCGWNPARNGNWWEYSRYVIALAPLEKDTSSAEY